MRASINRNVEHEILRGGHPRLVRAGWSPPAEELPLLDEESARYPSKKKEKKRSPKERCQANPKGRAHEWMKDTETVPLFEYVGPYWLHKEKRVGSFPVLYRLCAHCGKLQYKDHGRWQPGKRERSWYVRDFPTSALRYRRGGRIYLRHGFIF